MIVYLEQNVWDAGLQRFRWLFDEFENVVVGFSGGKDSTVTLELALIVAREKNRLPLPVMFLDQEGEWQGTIDTVREVMYRDEVKPMWFQIPMVMTNNASSSDRFHKCWDEDKSDLWIHEKDPISIKENVYEEDRFHELFYPILKHHFPEGNAIYVAGVRGEEAPKRIMTLTKGNVYKGVTWGKIFNRKLGYYTFYPLYDWSYTDIWHAIEVNNWKYCKVYDEMYRQRIPHQNMRISNVHHETALDTLTMIQEIEPKTWEKLTKVIGGANTIKHLDKSAFKCPKKLPHAFESWKEYAHYLADNLITVDEGREKIDGLFAKWEPIFVDDAIQRDFYASIITTILSNDWDLTKFSNWAMLAKVVVYCRLKKGRTDLELCRYRHRSK